MSKYIYTTSREIEESTRRTQEMLQQQLFSQQMMETLINDLLDLAKMENNKFTLNCKNFDLLEVIRGSFQILLPNASKNKVSLSAQIDNRSHLSLLRNIRGDPQRYIQILLNFISNSMKFVDQGGKVEVKLRLKSIQVD